VSLDVQNETHLLAGHSTKMKMMLTGLVERDFGKADPIAWVEK